MKVLLIAIGSSGDVHPIVGIGRGLLARGHDVTLVTNGHFRELVERQGLSFLELGTAEQYEQAIRDADIWHPRKGFGVIVDWLVQTMQPLYELVCERYEPGMVVCGATLALGARCAQDKLAIPYATIHLQPALFRSVIDPPTMSAWPPVPRSWARAMFWAMDRLFVDRILTPRLNEFRRTVGLPPVTRAFKGWVHSPVRTLGLFPEWYAAPQPDWPANVTLTGFPLYDEGDVTPPEVLRACDEYLAAGEPPIVFTPGSANRHAQRFFRAAVDACGELGRRALLLTRYEENLPGALPGFARHMRYVPLGYVLPRSAALVHHGGIGTAAQALACGLPQVITPLSHDQPDNAARVKRLGVGDWLLPWRFSGKRGARVLRPLIESGAVKARCAGLSRRVRAEDAVGRACGVIERLGGGHV